MIGTVALKFLCVYLSSERSALSLLKNYGCS